MQCLQTTLDREIALLERLVECTQKEQQQLLALETQNLEQTVFEKQRLLDRLDAQRLVRESELHQALRKCQCPPDETTLSALIERLPAGVGLELSARRDRLNALLAALKELNSAAGFYAEQKLKWIRACRKAISVEDPENGNYGPTGHIDDPNGTGRRLNASV